jgi:hypothetical protein
MEQAGPTPALGDNRSKPLALLLERSSQANPTGARNGKRHSVFSSHFTGVTTGAPLVLTKKVMNFAGSVALAFLETT